PYSFRLYPQYPLILPSEFHVNRVEPIECYFVPIVSREVQACSGKLPDREIPAIPLAGPGKRISVFLPLPFIDDQLRFGGCRLGIPCKRGLDSKRLPIAAGGAVVVDGKQHIVDVFT